MIVRDAKPQDARRIADIVNAAMRSPGVIWRSAPVDAGETLGWIEGPSRRSALLVVADEGDAALGFASLALFKPTAGWERCGEMSIYMHERWRGGGRGAALAEALIDRAAALGFQTVIVAIDAANIRSIAFHRRLGFEPIGEMRRAGVEAGAARDVALLERVMGG